MIHDVIVVGAGAAGLYAAALLSSQGADVRLLEATDRVGGRVRTVGFPNGLWANAGAEWINSDHEIVIALAKALNIELVPADGFEAAVVDGYPEPMPPELPGPAGESLASMAAEITSLDEPWNDPALRSLDQLNAVTWLTSLGMTPRDYQLAYAMLRGENMIEPAALSLAYLAVIARGEDDDRGWRVRHGTEALTDALAALLPSNVVRTGATVAAIHDRPHGVTVDCQEISLDARSVVLTAPPPALRRIQLPDRVVLPSLQTGSGGKVLVPYRDRPWERSEFPRTHREPNLDFIYHNAPQQSADGVVLTAYASQPLTTAHAVTAFERWYGESPSAESIDVRWHEMPSYGCTYSAPQPGYLDTLRAHRAMNGPVLFAGEHTEIVSGYVNSALMSAQRVASQLLGYEIGGPEILSPRVQRGRAKAADRIDEASR
ncbi:FAD-dependent oxidoreductase [Mycolicibacterium sp. P9-64]|uniref:flavin monoamine oxidase family protein n=1 Tax=Mycolicibacterium sp. P9-64 TaxID=2024612 RepID=UPI0011ED7B50|nr:NAD(P)/FAD-dependent oxidoreductase [Mycolicibacterium sp. P9-64]KAA0084577.1 FAD-dependent oxidoreductase [Mycolicibacterium sp. P9-64]